MHQLAGEIDIENKLLHSKALEPLSEEDVTELQRIEQLSKLSTYSEADVREEIVTPILKIMGYSKETMFSINREKYLRILDKGLSVDYGLTIWEENYWVIEAKKPNVTRGEFKYDHLWQVVQYAIHPEINAALVVLCDGHAFEVFDREESLERPLLRVERCNLTRDFDKLRLLLAPLQAWVFQKRRIYRLIEKTFENEYQVRRLNEARQLIDRQLRQKEHKTVDNWRKSLKDRDKHDDYQWAEIATPDELVAGTFFFNANMGRMNAVSARLVSCCHPSSFGVMNTIFPDGVRAVNDYYFMHALYFLMELEQHQSEVRWAPHWLTQKQGASVPTHELIMSLLKLCLSHFEQDQMRKTVVLFSNAARRVQKILCVTQPSLQKVAEHRHAIQRYWGEEFDFSQAVSSPSSHLLGMLEYSSNLATDRFVAANTPSKGGFKTETAKQQLKEIWQLEISLLKSQSSYGELVKEQEVDEIFPTECLGTRYDQLGHTCWCLLAGSNKWYEHALEHHLPEIKTLATVGTWKAREMMTDMKIDFSKPTEQIFADRFFFGETSTSSSLAKLYKFL